MSEGDVIHRIERVESQIVELKDEIDTEIKTIKDDMRLSDAKREDVIVRLSTMEAQLKIVMTVGFLTFAAGIAVLLKIFEGGN